MGFNDTVVPQIQKLRKKISDNSDKVDQIRRRSYHECDCEHCDLVYEPYGSEDDVDIAKLEADIKQCRADIIRLQWYARDHNITVPEEK